MTTKAKPVVNIRFVTVKGATYLRKEDVLHLITLATDGETHELQEMGVQLKTTLSNVE